MSKENNLTDFLTDVADAIREKKGTTDKINPQDFSDEIKGIKTSSSFWTGHVDVEGLKAIGWDDEDIAYFQEHGVNWMEEEDDYYKVSDDNKALYGVLTADNIQEYRDRIVWLPKVDFSGIVSFNKRFQNCKFLKGIPLIDTSSVVDFYGAFSNCFALTTIPKLNLEKVINLSYAFSFCRSLQFVPDIIIKKINNITHAFEYCFSLKEMPFIIQSFSGSINSVFKHARILNRINTGWLENATSITNSDYTFIGSSLKNFPKLNLSGSSNGIVEYTFSDCKVLRKIQINAENVNRFVNTFSGLENIEYVFIENLKANVSFNSSILLHKSSILYILEHEAATEPFTITLHADSYARLSTDSDIVAALENHPNVTLASA